MTTLVAFLDLAVCPCSFDAVVFIAQAEMERRKIDAERLHVVAFGEIRKKSQYNEAESEWRLWNIVLPAARLFGAGVTYTSDRTFALNQAVQAEGWWPSAYAVQSLRNRHHLVGGLIERAQAGEPIARPSASEHALRAVRKFAEGRKFVTMTTRETYLPERNSDAGAWAQAANEIARRGYSVQRIVDTSVALREGHGFSELNLDLRMAWYQTAEFNICANCGPASLLWLSDRPYVMMGAGVPAEEWDGLFVKQGLPLGETWPWALPHQRIAYGKDTAETILAEFDRWVSATS